MFENLEGLSSTSHLEDLNDARGLEERDYLSSLETNYLEEVLPFRDGDLIAARVDELSGCVPPKGIDSNKEVAEMIEPFVKEISPLFLEAPADSVQISEVVETMEGIEGLDYSVWREAGFEQRVEALQSLESSIAEIAHRPDCVLNVQELGEGHYGYFDPTTKEITINSSYIMSNNFNDYKECLDTIVHEGRHAYQDYNMNEREVHPRGTEVDNWRLNNNGQIGYLDAETWGFELYQYQPMEADARAFAGDVLNQFCKNA